MAHARKEKTTSSRLTCKAFLTTSETYLSIVWSTSSNVCSMETEDLRSVLSSVFIAITSMKREVQWLTRPGHINMETTHE